MTAAALLAEALAAGVRIEARLWADPLDRLPPDLRGRLRDRQADVLTLLAVRQSPAPAPLPDAAPVPCDPGAPAPPLPAAQPPPIRCPPSWSDAACRPKPGACCSCCAGRRWWGEGATPTGWRCRNCHPPAHLPMAGIVEVET